MLKDKLNHTLNRINDKLKRRATRLNNGQEHDAVHAKKPRTLPTDGVTVTASQSSTQTHYVDIAGLPVGHVSQVPRPSGSSDAMSITQDPTYSLGSMSVEYLHAVVTQASSIPPGSLANPFDLTANSNSPTETSSWHSHPLIDLTSAFSPTPSTRNHLESTGLLSPESIDAHRNMDRNNEMQSELLDRQVVPSPASYGAARRLLQADNSGRKSLSNGDEEFARVLSSNLNPSLAPPAAAFRIGQVQANEDDLAAFTSHIMVTVCPKCRRSLFSEAEAIIRRTKELLETGVLHPYLLCRKCKTRSCVGCKKANKRPDKDLEHQRNGVGFKLAWCCVPGRLFLIWSLCCGTEFQKPEFRSILGGKVKNKQKPEPEPFNPTPRALSKGIGYGGHGGHGYYTLSSSSAGAESNALASLTNTVSPSDDEKRLTTWFSALESVLPKLAFWQQISPFDSEPPPIIEFMLRRSPLLPRAAELLRNDSMEAILARHDLYEALLRLIGTISNHVSTSAVVYNELTIYPLEEQLIHFQPSSVGSNATLASCGRPSPRGKGKQIDRGSSLADIIANLARQCQHLNRVATVHSKEFVTAESARMLALSQRICQLASQHEASQLLMSQYSKATISESCVAKQPVSNVLTRSKEAEKAREEFKALHRDSCVMDLPEQELLSNFQFRGDAEALSLRPAATSKGRMKKLVAQVTNLRTSLPEGIWVRHGNSRLDVMKVLMIGPRGTPYEHGLFEFDLFCPADFPNSPPLMRFRTNGGGRVRFNPNLYHDGKVCLSLLGTWTGESWKAAYSTILQVLVSIHGMIFVDEPWYNEPGREHLSNERESMAYNIQIQQYTMKHALLDWLNQRLAQPSGAAVPRTVSEAAPSAITKHLFHSASPAASTSTADPVKDDPIWGEIIRKHFAANGKAIMETVKKWKEIGCQGPVVELQEVLARHGFI